MRLLDQGIDLLILREVLHPPIVIVTQLGQRLLRGLTRGWVESLDRVDQFLAELLGVLGACTRRGLEVLEPFEQRRPSCLELGIDRRGRCLRHGRAGLRRYRGRRRRRRVGRPAVIANGLGGSRTMCTRSTGRRLLNGIAAARCRLGFGSMRLPRRRLVRRGPSRSGFDKRCAQRPGDRLGNVPGIARLGGVERIHAVVVRGLSLESVGGLESSVTRFVVGRPRLPCSTGCPRVRIITATGGVDDVVAVHHACRDCGRSGGGTAGELGGLRRAPFAGSRWWRRSRPTARRGGWS